MNTGFSNSPQGQSSSFLKITLNFYIYTIGAIKRLGGGTGSHLYLNFLLFFVMLNIVTDTLLGMPWFCWFGPLLLSKLC